MVYKQIKKERENGKQVDIYREKGQDRGREREKNGRQVD